MYDHYNYYTKRLFILPLLSLSSECIYSNLSIQYHVYTVTITANQPILLNIVKEHIPFYKKQRLHFSMFLLCKQVVKLGRTIIVIFFYSVSLEIDGVCAIAHPFFFIWYGQLLPIYFYMVYCFLHMFSSWKASYTNTFSQAPLVFFITCYKNWIGLAQRLNETYE